ncbi:MAG: hypothetical protein N3F65_03085 [Nitrososphaeria archaeon]|nr:hypothetical protein [Aigarchaeota archaeon]MCX8187575.1 hypothetical protein [Nitrososphaeria archaeon]MDW8021291.1 hypothetical protein [Nitrososphaerota archaeon]
MGRKRRKVIKKVVKPLPQVFACPLCHEEAVAVYHEEGTEYAKVVCANCKVSAEVKWLPSYMPVDAYAEFYDIVTGAKKPVQTAVEVLGDVPGTDEAESVSGPEPDLIQGEDHEASESRED